MNDTGEDNVSTRSGREILRANISVIRFRLFVERHRQYRRSILEQGLRDTVHTVHNSTVGPDNYRVTDVRLLDPLHVPHQDADRRSTSVFSDPIDRINFVN
jgi:hypothetical protein